MVYYGLLRERMLGCPFAAGQHPAGVVYVMLCTFHSLVDTLCSRTQAPVSAFPQICKLSVEVMHGRR